MRTYDFSPLFRSSVGFDRLPRLMEAAAQAQDPSVGHVPYNIEQRGEDAYRITLAVAGFGIDDLQIEVREGALVVTGKLPEEADDRSYLHRGISARSFRETFQLADHVKVTGASLANGLLDIELVRELPEEMRPRQIQIGTAKDGARRSKPNKVIEGRKAAA